MDSAPRLEFRISTRSTCRICKFARRFYDLIKEQLIYVEITGSSTMTNTSVEHVLSSWSLTTKSHLASYERSQAWRVRCVIPSIRSPQP